MIIVTKEFLLKQEISEDWLQYLTSNNLINIEPVIILKNLIAVNHDMSLWLIVQFMSEQDLLKYGEFAKEQIHLSVKQNNENYVSDLEIKLPIKGENEWTEIPKEDELEVYRTDMANFVSEAIYKATGVPEAWDEFYDKEPKACKEMRKKILEFGINLVENNK